VRPPLVPVLRVTRYIIHGVGSNGVRRGALFWPCLLHAAFIVTVVLQQSTTSMHETSFLPGNSSPLAECTTSAE
jgi:hypothetical protein